MADFSTTIVTVNGFEIENTDTSLQDYEYRVNAKDLVIPVLDSLSDNLFSISYEPTSNTFSPVVYSAGQPAAISLMTSGGTREAPTVTTDASGGAAYQAFAWLGTVSPGVVFTGQLEFDIENVTGANLDQPTVDVFLSTAIAGVGTTHFGRSVASGTYVRDLTISEEAIPVLKDSSAIHDVRSTTKGSIYSPKMTTAEFASIAAKAEGLGAWDNVKKRPSIYDGSAVKDVAFLSDIGQDLIIQDDNVTVGTITSTLNFSGDFFSSVDEGANKTTIRINGPYYSHFYMNGNAVSTPLTLNTPAKVLGTTVQNITVPNFVVTANRITWTGTQSNAFTVNATLCVEGDLTINKQFKMYVYKNGVELPELQTCSDIQNTNRFVNVAISGLTSMLENDYLELWIENIENNEDAIVIGCSLSIVSLTNN